jgi:hypothetical protein
MALLMMVPPAQAEGKLADLYAMTEQFFGAVPNNVRLLGVSPSVLENQLHFAQYFMSHPNLSMQFLTTLRMLVAKRTSSPYCEGLNKGLLMRQGVSAEEIDSITADPSEAPMSEKEKALLQFVLKALREPQSATADDVKNLESLGWTQSDLLDAVAHGARAVATNIIFDTFKLEND